MSFNDLKIRNIYIVPRNDVVNDFFVPVLAQSVRYDRGSAYFSSQALYEMTVGIKGLIDNGGKMRYIISPENLSQEDIDAIHDGYKRRDDYKRGNLLSRTEYYFNPQNYYEKERLSILAYLIANSYLDIKIAIPKNVQHKGVFHYKFGVFTDNVGNEILFNGSNNETENAIHNNNEIFNTYSTLKGDDECISEVSSLFEDLWNNNDKYDEVFDFPEDIKAKILTYYKENPNFDIDKEEFRKEVMHSEPKKPEAIKLHEYQEKAVKNWADNNYIGIFDMATGSGKTWTALYGITKLLEKERVVVTICCPYQHLVDQWCEDLDKWGFDYYAGYTGSKTRQWKKKLHENILDFNRKISKYLCFITTNASFATKYVQDELSSVDGKQLLVVDEAHNFGTKRLLSLLDDRYNYRLALSATIDRYNDKSGTQGLYDFFEKKCISYTLKDAIHDDKLTHYFYYPVIVYLTSEELEKYNQLTEDLRRETRYDKDNDKVFFSEKGKKILIERARVVAGAENKISKLRELMSTRTHTQHNLIYCGATTVNDVDYKDGVANYEEKRQVDAVTKMLSTDLHMKVSRFTSAEDAEERRKLIKAFDEGTMCQALVAIKCLDEGISIKSIETAYILASSTNPREYIQRRGRVLRKFPGKTYAYIYDFVTLPRNLKTVNKDNDKETDMSLLKRELIRVKDFEKLAENPSDSDKIFKRIEETYGYINLSDDEEDNYE